MGAPAGTLPDTAPVRLVEEEATHTRIEELLAQTLDAATEQDTVLLTFAGNGTHNYWFVAYDTSLADLADTTLFMASLAERFRRSKAWHILLVLDCCFSGGAPAKVIEDGLQARGGSYSLESAFTGRGRMLLAAANVEEKAYHTEGGLPPLAVPTLTRREILLLAPVNRRDHGLISCRADCHAAIRESAQQLAAVRPAPPAVTASDS